MCCKHHPSLKTGRVAATKRLGELINDGTFQHVKAFLQLLDLHRTSSPFPFVK